MGVLSIPVWFRVETGTNPVNAPVICNHSISAIPQIFWSARGYLSDGHNSFTGQNGNLPDRKKYSSWVGVGLWTDFYHQFAKSILSRRENKIEITVSKLMFLSISLCFFFRENSVKKKKKKKKVQWQYIMVSLGSALLDSQLSAFSDSQQIS